MSTPPPPTPRLRSIMLGVLVVVTLIVFLCSASAIVKWAGTTFLVLPRVVGLLESVRGDEIVALPMDSSPTAVGFPRAERYQVYTSDLELLEIAASLHASDATPWLVVQRGWLDPSPSSSAAHGWSGDELGGGISRSGAARPRRCCAAGPAAGAEAPALCSPHRPSKNRRGGGGRGRLRFRHGT